MSPIVRYLNPWQFRRQQRELQLAALRHRDGDNCTRCRRPIAFDLRGGEEHGAKVERIIPASAGGTEALDNLCLTHRRCNTSSADHTVVVLERVRLKAEAQKPAKKPRRRRAA